MTHNEYMCLRPGCLIIRCSKVILSKLAYGFDGSLSQDLIVSQGDVFMIIEHRVLDQRDTYQISDHYVVALHMSGRNDTLIRIYDDKFIERWCNVDRPPALSL